MTVPPNELTPLMQLIAALNSGATLTAEQKGSAGVLGGKLVGIFGLPVVERPRPVARGIPPHVASFDLSSPGPIGLVVKKFVDSAPETS